MEEFYLESVLEAQVLRSNLENLSADAQRRLASLEELLEDSDRSALADLSPEESMNEWYKAHRTGDPLIDKWEQEIAQGKIPNLNEDFEEF